MKRRLLTILIFILLGLSGNLQAYNFSIIYSGNNLYFKIKDIENKYVEVTSELESGLFYSTDNKPTGSVVIPSTVSNNGITYYVVSIGENAFSGCDEISSITIPNSITSIQSAAFSNCTGINTITFLGLPPTISSSAFISIPTIIPVNVYCNLGLSYYSAPNFTFSNIQEMPCPVISDTTKYIEIKGTNAITNLYLQGGNGMQWVKKGNEGLVFYPGGAVNISNSANKKIKIYGDFTYLKCNNASLNYIDISHSTSLVNLDCSDNLFDSLSLNSQLLKSLTCGSNQLQYLNLSGCSALEKLNSSSSISGILNSLNISGCTALREANFTNQKRLTELNISNLPSFTTLKIDRSSFSTIIADNSPNFDTIYCKQISSSCTYDSLLTSLPTKESGRIGFIYFGDSITTEQSSCRDNIAIAKGWKFYYKTPSGVNISKTPNTDYSCFIVNLLAQPNDIAYGSVTGGGSYEETANVIIEAIPFEDNIFLYWSDDQNNTNAQRAVFAQDTTFTAVFRHFNLVYDTIAICQGAHYQFFNTSLSDAGDYNYEDTVSTTLFNLQNLNLSLKPIFNTSITAFICEGETYTENGFSETLTGIYTDTLQAINGCDSILHLDLTVNPIYNDTITAFICQGETYTQFGFSQTTAGIYTQSLQTINGCDSIVNLSLITNPIHNDTIRATICQGETYSLNGFSETSPGLYTQNLQDINGCDSIVNLSLLVNRIYNITFNAAIYNGQTYSSNGFNQSIAGFYTQNLQTINGCDSIVNLNLMLYPLNTTMLEESICQGEDYTENGFNENTSGLYSQTLDDINGGDSIVS
ncbi:MAG: leucine-rich repeat protein, partial [Bacteroidales bacterium]